MDDQSTTPEEEVETADHPDALSPKQERALQALLTHTTRKEAAAAADISLTTLWRFEKDPAFARRLREACREATAHTVIRLQQAAPEAVSVLQELMNKERTPPASRITAARTVIDYSFRAGEVEELRAQVEELQAFLKGKQAEQDVEDTYYKDRVGQLEELLKGQREEETEGTTYIV